jgi:serine/threonine-protein kinase HipA
MLHPGGRFQLAPFYDVISAQPSIDSKQIPWKHFRLAMSFGDKPHYEMRQVAPRHFAQTANRAGMGKQVVSTLIMELLSGFPSAIDRVLSELPSGFPDEVVRSIIDGIRRRLRVLETTEQSSTVGADEKGN